jgi:RluA family pseudouridine synthase
MPDVPLSAIFRRLRTGDVKVDGKKAAPSLRIAAGMVVELRLWRDASAEPAVAAEPFRGDEPGIVHRDADVLVVDKPVGMAAQPGSGLHGRDLVSWLRARIGDDGSARTFAPAPAHRIDRGTSGLCAIGLSAAGLRGLTAAFRDGGVDKVYLAVVHGVPSPPRGSIDLPLREVEDAAPDAPRVVVDGSGKPAHTEYEVQQRGAGRALLRVTIHSGRMHQIRAHLAHLGHPIVGDRRYGSSAQIAHGFLLHAAELHFAHPVTGERLDLVCKPPHGFHC